MTLVQKNRCKFTWSDQNHIRSARIGVSVESERVRKREEESKGKPDSIASINSWEGDHAMQDLDLNVKMPQRMYWASITVYFSLLVLLSLNLMLAVV